MTAKEHNKLLSIFFFAQGGLQLFGGVLMALIYGGMGSFMLASARREEEQVMGGIFVVLAVVIGLVILLFAALDLFVGYSLLKERSIGRTLGIIMSVISLFGFPLGTALGIYGLWFLLGDVGKNFYLGNSSSLSSIPPPQPNSWQ